MSTLGGLTCECALAACRVAMLGVVGKQHEWWGRNERNLVQIARSEVSLADPSWVTLGFAEERHQFHTNPEKLTLALKALVAFIHAPKHEVQRSNTASSRDGDSPLA